MEKPILSRHSVKRMKKATFALKVLEENLLPQLISLLKDVYVSDESAYMKIMLNFDTLLQSFEKTNSRNDKIH